MQNLVKIYQFILKPIFVSLHPSMRVHFNQIFIKLADIQDIHKISCRAQ